MAKRLRVEKGGERLDRYLQQNFPDVSRSWIQRLIGEGKIKIGDRLPTPHTEVKTGDLIQVDFSKPAEPSLEPDKSVPWTLIFEHTQYAVVSKPAGIVVHPGGSHGAGTLVNGLLHRYPEMAKVGDDPLRPGIVHRLDKEVFGLMIVARTQLAFDYFKKQFQARRVKKQYQAIVLGDKLPDQGEITFAITRSKTGRMASVAARRAGEPGVKSAETHYEIIRRYVGCCLVLVTTITGRTHQIRAHFHGLGHPILGDELYRTKLSGKLKIASPLFLCATELEFTDLDGDRRQFSVPLPAPYQEVLQSLKIRN
ncbi:MAG: RluA family pseudouridine synthase [bacterium]|nr:RluA family pseudouridine synthase [bacterium]